MAETFQDDLNFLNDHVDTIVLKNSERQQLAVVPAWQGRTMTSTANGPLGFSYGWINRKRISSGTVDPKVNLFGGEDRIWISPEGSQFSFFFKPGDPMDLSHWRTPSALDMQSFNVIEQDQRSAVFEKSMTLQNYAGSSFPMQITRRVQINDDSTTAQQLQMDLPKTVNSVSHESHNSVKNVGDRDWMAADGLPAVWMLCMNKPSDRATVLVPFQSGDFAKKGQIVTADYFGELDESRLQVCEPENLIVFLGDGKLRSKLGVAYSRAVDFLGAWDAERGCLTIVQYNLPSSTDVGYTNNLWKHVDDPFNGDVINSYNDGPDELGGMMGPFYELETLSPALALKQNESFTHIHRTIHLEGERSGLNQIAEHVFGVGLDWIEKRFG